MSAQKGFIVPLVLFGIVALFSGVGLGLYLYYYPHPQNQKLVPPTESTAMPQSSAKPIITDFESCIKAGNPIQESYPRKCSAEGKLFTEVISEDSLKNSIPTVSTHSAQLSVKEGWVLYTGSADETTNPDAVFTIEYPITWKREKNVVYPHNVGDLEPHFVLGAGGHGWYRELQIKNKEYPFGIVSYSWGKPEGKNYTVGFGSISGAKYTYIFEASFIPEDEKDTLQKLFDEMIGTFKMGN